MGPHGAVTRYMSPANRECHIERVGRHYDREVRVGLPHKMWRAGVRAKAELDSTNARIGPLERSLVTPLGVTNTTEVRVGLVSLLDVVLESIAPQQSNAQAETCSMQHCSITVPVPCFGRSVHECSISWR